MSYGQEEKFKLLGTEYAYHYLPEFNEFKICKITDSTTVCNRYTIPKTEYLLVDLLEKNRNYFNENKPIFLGKVDRLKDSLYRIIDKCWSKHSTATFEKLSNKETSECKDLTKHIKKTETMEVLLSFLKEKSNLPTATQFRDSIIKKVVQKTEKRLKQYYTDKIEKQQHYTFLTSYEFATETTSHASQTNTSSTTTTNPLIFISLLLKNESIWLKLKKNNNTNPDTLEKNTRLFLFPKAIDKDAFISSFSTQF